MSQYPQNLLHFKNTNLFNHLTLTVRYQITSFKEKVAWVLCYCNTDCRKQYQKTLLRDRCRFRTVWDTVMFIKGSNIHMLPSLGLLGYGQWAQAEANVLERLKQPCLTLELVVRYTVGLAACFCVWPK